MQVKQSGAPVIYFGTDTTTLLSEIKKTRADVVGLDWRVPLDVGWSKLGGKVAVQGNLDPVALFASRKELEMRACEILDRVGARPGHIFNLGHGILPETPVENVKALASFVQEHSTRVARGQS
jgi:uroporphyrinogen decarboxylase